MPTITITPDYDGSARFDGTNYVKFTNPSLFILNIGMEISDKTAYLWRAFAEFPLDSLPAGAPVTQVRRYVYCRRAGGAVHLLDDHAYGSNGQEDPHLDDAQTCYDRCASGNLYSDDSTDLQTTGDKWRTLGGTICADVQAAKAAVNRFTLAWHEEGDDDPYGDIGDLEFPYPPILEITYTPPPPGVWGGDTHLVQMAKAILGFNYIPWSKRFPKLIPKTF